MHQKFIDPSTLEPHKPLHYICGVFVPDIQDWIGQFEATADQLIVYGAEADLNGREYEIVYNMIETQAIYEEWWYRVKKS